MSHRAIWYLCILVLVLASCSQRRSEFYKPYAGKGDREYSTEGVASWYGQPFHGRLTASGERYDMNELTAAHRTLPFGAYLKVTNLTNDQSVVVMVNDRGPFAKNRLIDLSRAAARQLNFEADGTTRVHLEWIEDPSDHPYVTEQESTTPPEKIAAEPLAEESEEGDLIAETIQEATAESP